MSRPGPDIVCSMDPSSAKELIEGANILFEERGGIKGAVAEEQSTIDFAFATVVTISDIKKGDILSKENIWVKRPGTGEIKAESFNDLLGKKASIDISNNTHLKWNNVD